MAVELDHPFSTARSIDDSYAVILDLERVIPCVEGGSVIERDGPESAKAEIKVKMGAMSMKFTGTVEIVEQDAAAHTRGAERQVARGRRPGPRERDGHVHAARRRRHRAHERADHRQGRVDGRGRRRPACSTR